MAGTGESGRVVIRLPAASRAVSLRGAELGRLRHICALFDGQDDEADALDRFVVEGLITGERVVHLVESREAYLGRLSTVIDVSTALESGQLDVRSWDDSYLSGGAFNSSRMLTLVRRLLRDGQAHGVRATRLIGDMGWARDGISGVDELDTYEWEVGKLVSRPFVSVVCAYDTQRNSPDQIAAILPLHQAALVGRRLQLARRNGSATGPWDRIMAAAGVLFAENGINRTGVDTLIEAAGVAKATFYRHFPSKDALILAWLRNPHTRWFDRVRMVAEARAATPGERIPRIFEAVADWMETEDFVGCPYLNTSVEISDPSHPARGAVRDYLAEIGDYLEECVAAAGHQDAPRLGREVHALLAGSIALGVANRTSSFVGAARDAAIELLEG
jgi:AcrR family transcriptional regulator